MAASCTCCEQLQRQREYDRCDQLAAWRQRDQMLMGVWQMPRHVRVGQHEDVAGSAVWAYRFVAGTQVAAGIDEIGLTRCTMDFCN